MSMDITEVDRLVDEITELRDGMEETHRTRQGVDESEFSDHYQALELCAVLLREVSADVGEERNGDSQLISEAAELLAEREVESSYPGRGEDWE
ncbi:hypothetical protein [Halolamina salifodinae]|uniref:Uncharacterized protein n=1 Tax=Halolamina salifodinae TaxID=1202767 RepID=A0A8T4GYX3_9EURY|nr:hypothetical protein [Halolamina salifodinae]MBP1986754.1 hypothetical protein [Halolamina salifodinae]